MKKIVICLLKKDRPSSKEKMGESDLSYLMC
jgi:hypothetical protein